MRILIGSDLFYPILYTGGEVHSFNIARCLVKLGHDVTVIAARTAFHSCDIESLKKMETIDGVEIIRTRTPYAFGSTISSIASMREMYVLTKEQIEKNKVDVVCPVKPRAYFPLFLASHNKVPCVALFHDIYTLKFLSLAGFCLQEVTLRLPYDHILTVSYSIKQRLFKYYSENKISVIYNGLDLKMVDSVSNYEKKCSQLIFIGNLQAHKNIFDTIKALELARHDIGDLELIIISTGGPHEALLKAIIKDKPYIKYLGKVSDEEKIRYLKQSNLLLLTSSAEGFGLVLIEALSCQTPFLAYDIPAVREVYGLTSGGVLVPHRDWQAMAKAIVLLLRDSNKMRDLATNGRKQIESRFTWEKVAMAEEKILEGIISSSKITK